MLVTEMEPQIRSLRNAAERCLLVTRASAACLSFQASYFLAAMRCVIQRSTRFSSTGMGSAPPSSTWS